MIWGVLWYDFRKFSYCNYTTCVNFNNLSQIESNIIEIFEHEEYHHISKPKLPQDYEPIIQILRSSPWEMMSDLWVIALSAGNYEWTILKTSVPELFCHKSKQSNSPLLSKLAKKLECDTFHHSVTDRDWGVLIEANSQGQTLASGYLESDYLEYMQFYTKDIKEPNVNRNFSLIVVPEEFQQAGKVSFIISEEEKQKREEELEALYQSEQKEIRDQAWSEWKNLNMSWVERTNEDLGKLICKSDSFWHENNLLYKVYTEPEELEKAGVRLLFFQLRDHSTEEIWSPITSQRDYGIEQDIPF